MTRYQRSMQIWMLLACAARERKSYTYGQLSTILEMGGAGIMSKLLAPISNYCEREGYPPLTALAVNRDSGRPGDGLAQLAEDVDVERERVFNHSWFGMEPPKESDFANADRNETVDGQE